MGRSRPGQTQATFPTQEAKDEVALKTFGDLQSKYPGSDEGEIAGYYLGAIKADQGKLAEAEKNFKEVADKGNAKYASLAKVRLAQIYFADGRADQGESTLRDLMANPTIYVSKEQATITLARGDRSKKPAEARKLLDPLRAATWFRRTGCDLRSTANCPLSRPLRPCMLARLRFRVER